MRLILKEHLRNELQNYFTLKKQTKVKKTGNLNSLESVVPRSDDMGGVLALPVVFWDVGEAPIVTGRRPRTAFGVHGTAKFSFLSSCTESSKLRNFSVCLSRDFPGCRSCDLHRCVAADRSYDLSPDGVARHDLLRLDSRCSRIMRFS